MILSVYRWRLKPERRDEFIAVWSEVTQILRGRGSGGSALFDGPDGIVWAMARWPNADVRAAAFDTPLSDAFGPRMDECIAERLETLELNAIADLWVGFSESKFE